MADEQTIKTTPIRTAILSLNPKIVLAFFLVIVAASLVVFLTRTLVGNDGKLDAGTIALLASFITMFIKMASDGIGYQFNSSSGSDKKDDTQAKVADKLADKVAVPPAAPAPITPVAPTTDMLGDSMLSNGQLTYFKSLTDDEAKKAFLAKSAAEREATVAKVGT